MLINLQPHGLPMDLEVRLGGRGRNAGTAWDCAEKVGDVTAALGTLQDLERAGLFRLRVEAVWEFELEFRSPEDWAQFGTWPSFGGVAADRQLIDAVLPRLDGYLVLTDEHLAQVYERTPPPVRS